MLGEGGRFNTPTNKFKLKKVGQDGEWVQSLAQDILYVKQKLVGQFIVCPALNTLEYGSNGDQIGSIQINLI